MTKADSFGARTPSHRPLTPRKRLSRRWPATRSDGREQPVAGPRSRSSAAHLAVRAALGRLGLSAGSRPDALPSRSLAGCPRPAQYEQRAPRARDFRPSSAVAGRSCASRPQVGRPWLRKRPALGSDAHRRFSIKLRSVALLVTETCANVNLPCGLRSMAPSAIASRPAGFPSTPINTLANLHDSFLGHVGFAGFWEWSAEAAWTTQWGFDARDRARPS